MCDSSKWSSCGGMHQGMKMSGFMGASTKIMVMGKNGLKELLKVGRNFHLQPLWIWRRIYPVYSERKRMHENQNWK